MKLEEQQEKESHDCYCVQLKQSLIMVPSSAANVMLPSFDTVVMSHSQRATSSSSGSSNSFGVTSTRSKPNTTPHEHYHGIQKSRKMSYKLPTTNMDSNQRSLNGHFSYIVQRNNNNNNGRPHNSSTEAFPSQCTVLDQNQIHTASPRHERTHSSYNYVVLLEQTQPTISYVADQRTEKVKNSSLGLCTTSQKDFAHHDNHHDDVEHFPRHQLFLDQPRTLNMDLQAACYAQQQQQFNDDQQHFLPLREIQAQQHGHNIPRIQISRYYEETTPSTTPSNTTTTVTVATTVEPQTSSNSSISFNSLNQKPTSGKGNETQTPLSSLDPNTNYTNPTNSNIRPSYRKSSVSSYSTSILARSNHTTSRLCERTRVRGNTYNNSSVVSFVHSSISSSSSSSSCSSSPTSSGMVNASRLAKTPNKQLLIDSNLLMDESSHSENQHPSTASSRHPNSNSNGNFYTFISFEEFIHSKRPRVKPSSISKAEMLRVLRFPQTMACKFIGCSLSTLKRRFYELKQEFGLMRWPQSLYEMKHLEIYPQVNPMSLAFILNEEEPQEEALL
ncbi:hypothetical protein C9374_008506 [Naegleria lovaniensis]|uniref:RWP-RK domain-containing protein n=1 Tax=Naegleria lovaniensis TaxID=51637 RepID=A0AA88GGZ8_NAELO|nr:uncharacterized protein C9374_008506 [Naegleria lovaniensis]KAG2378363.1 hypothetical protein C9374_008506 [Naegleria lovaniensis]